jgi:hypothetical protein
MDWIIALVEDTIRKELYEREKEFLYGELDTIIDFSYEQYGQKKKKKERWKQN